MILPEGFKLAPKDRLSKELKQKNEALEAVRTVLENMKESTAKRSQIISHLISENLVPIKQAVLYRLLSNHTHNSQI